MVGVLFAVQKTIVVGIVLIVLSRIIPKGGFVLRIIYGVLLVTLIALLTFYGLIPDEQDGFKHHLSSRCESHIPACVMRARVALADQDWVVVEKIYDYLSSLQIETSELKRLKLLLNIRKDVNVVAQEVDVWLSEHDDVVLLETAARAALMQNHYDISINYYNILLEHCRDESQRFKILQIISQISQERA